MRSVRPTLASIVATIGPASDKPEMVAKLIDAGVAVFRLNFSHGTLEQHAQRLATIRQVADSKNMPIGVLGDLSGPKIRIGLVPEGGIMLETGQEFLIDPAIDVARPSSSSVLPTVPVFPCSYKPIGSDVLPGHKVLINDGAVRALAIEHQAGDPAGSLRCVTTTGGLVTSKKGLNLPQSDLSVPAITDWDWTCVEWAVGKGLDYLALSFVRSADEVRQLQDRLAGMCSIDGVSGGGGALGGASIPVIAKIEKPQAVANVDSIAQQADGLMVARGDLGVEMDLAAVPVAQKRIIAAADSWGKPCIVATQMLESMITAPIPTRAETTDVSNAILDGADAVMLSAESATGQYPVLAVETMRRIIAYAEEYKLESMAPPSPPSRVIATGYRTAALAHAAWYLVRDIKAKMVVVWSQMGGAARYLSQTGLPVPIVAYSSSAAATRRMALLKGVTALHASPPPGSSLSQWNAAVEADLLSREWVKEGDAIVLLAGRPLGVAKTTTTLAVAVIGDHTSGFFKHG
jgi:pyruvate kinase